ncbi:hypothetical protein [Salinimicrobium flavum]
MKLKYLLSLVAVIFGLVTIFASSSVLFGYSDVLEKEGNFPSFILWVNLLTGPLYLLAAAGLFYSKRWTLPVLTGILLLLIVNLGFLILLITTGQDYELETLGAIAVRIALTSVLTFFAFNKSTINI